MLIGCNVNSTVCFLLLTAAITDSACDVCMCCEDSDMLHSYIV